MTNFIKYFSVLFPYSLSYKNTSNHNILDIMS